MDTEKAPLLTPPPRRRRSILPTSCKSWERWQTDYCSCLPARYVLAIMSFLGILNVYALRVNLSVAIVEMDNRTATVHRSAHVFSWTSTESGWILSSFFYGYIITQIPGGWLATRFGGKWVFGIGIIMTSVFSLLTPLAIDHSLWLLVTVRGLEGFFEGVTYPAIQAMWGQWAPSPERSKLATITFTGSSVGTIISFPLSAVLCQYGFNGGWPSVFYVFGTIGIMWFILWIFTAFDSPASHPRISPEEREYIESHLPPAKEELDTPWLSIFTSPAVWAIIIAHTCQTWGAYTLLTCIPTYFQQALNLTIGGSDKSIVMNGVFSAVPYTLLAIVAPLSGQAADFLRGRGLSTVIVRKIFTTAGFLLSATFLLLCGYFGTTTATAVTFVTLAVGLNGLTTAGYSVNHLDIAPRFAGILMGITNMAGTIPGIVGPQIAKAIAVTPHSPNGSTEYYHKFREEWRQVFIISAEVCVFGALVYLILASGKKQPWADGYVSSKTVRTAKSDKTAASIVVSSDGGMDERVWEKRCFLNDGERVTAGHVQQ